MMDFEYEIQDLKKGRAKCPLGSLLRKTDPLDVLKNFIIVRAVRVELLARDGMSQDVKGGQPEGSK